MHVAIGLGPIGGNIGARLAELGRPVHGYDLSADRVREWSQGTGSPAGSDLAAVDWTTVTSVHIAVRTADQVTSVLASLQDHATGPLTAFVHTTLAPADARTIFDAVPESWRAFEAPVSGGPQGARAGSMTVFLAGPEPSEQEDDLLGDISGRVFRMPSYGQPALVKLLNNTLGTYVLAATARILTLGTEQGVPAEDLLDVVNASTGRSWMSESFARLEPDQVDLLLKDVGLLRGEIGALPSGGVDDDLAQAFLEARRQLGEPA